MSERDSSRVRPVAVGNMKIRAIGGSSIGITLDRDGLEELEIVDEDGELTGDYYAHQVIREDGTVELSLKDE